MDGFGYKNWSDTSYDSSPPTYGSEDPYGFQGDSRTGRQSMKSSLSSTNMRSSGGDEYNFEINGDDDDDSPDYHTKSKSSTRFTAAAVPANTRRMSQEERMKEILDRNRRESVAGLAKTEPPPETYISMIKSSWDEAIGGDGSERNSDASLYETLNKVTANADSRGNSNSNRRDSNGYGRDNGGAVSPLSDKEDDSFNLSAADFEVCISDLVYIMLSCILYV